MKNRTYALNCGRDEHFARFQTSVAISVRIQFDHVDGLGRGYLVQHGLGVVLSAPSSSENKQQPT